jgi:hypothetical protein
MRTVRRGRTRGGAPSIAVSLVALLVVSCAPRSEPVGEPEPVIDPAPKVGLVTERDRYRLQPWNEGKAAFIVATLTAPPDTTVHIVNCGGQMSWGLQRQEGGQWIDAWIGETNECLSPPIVVRAGTSYTDTMRLVSITGERLRHGTIRHDVPPGIYRVVLHNALTSFDVDARPFGPDLSIERRASAPITIEGGP